MITSTWIMNPNTSQSTNPFPLYIYPQQTTNRCTRPLAMYPAILLYITHLLPLPMLCINVKLKDPIVCATTASARRDILTVKTRMKATVGPIILYLQSLQKDRITVFKFLQHLIKMYLQFSSTNHLIKYKYFGMLSQHHESQFRLFVQESQFRLFGQFIKANN